MDNIQKNQQQFNPFLVPLKAGIVFLYSIQSSVILLSLGSIQITRGISIGIILLSAILCTGYIIYQIKRSKFGESQIEKGFFPKVFLTTIIVGSLVYVMLWILSIAAPDISWDGNAYHIPCISMWASKGYVHWIETSYASNLLNNYPKGAEVIAYAVTLAFGNTMLNTLNLIFVPLGILGIASLAYSFGARTLPALCAGFLYILIPVNINQSPTTYVDSAFASSVIAFIAIWLNSIQTDAVKWSSVIPLGSSLGLSLSIKSTAIAISVFALIILFGTWIFNRKRNSAHPHPFVEEKKHKEWILKLIILCAVILIATVGGGYWYLRDLIYTGSPIAPVGISFFGKVIFPGVSTSTAINEPYNTPQEFIQYPAIVRVFITWLQGLSKWPISIKGYDSRFGSIGFLWLIGCIPSILLIIAQKFRGGFLPRTGFFSLFILIFSTFIITPMNWWARYTLWIYALGLPAFACMLTNFSSLQATHLIVKRLLNIWLFSCLCLSMFEGLYCTFDVIDVNTPGSLSSSPAILFEKKTWTWPVSYIVPDEGNAIKDVLAIGKIVAISATKGSGYFYYGLVGQLSQPIGKRTIIKISEDVDIDQLREQNIDFIIWDEDISTPQQFSIFPFKKVTGFYIFEIPKE